MAVVLSIGKSRWLAGMTWLSYESVPTKSEIADDAETHHADWVAVRTAMSDYRQVGYCSAVKGEKTGKLASLAARIASAHPQPWQGVFQISSDLYWYIAVRENQAIMPDGDVLGSNEEIAAIRARHDELPDWKRVTGQLADLQVLVEAAIGRPVFVRPATGSPIATIAFFAGTLIVAVAAAGYWWFIEQAEQQARASAIARERQRLAALANAPKPAAPAAALTVPPSPAPGALLAACANEVLDLPLSWAGWALDGVECSQRAATAVWKRQEGATLDAHPDGSVAADGETITQALAYPALQEISPAPLLPRAEAALRLRAWAQRTGVALVLSAPAPRPPALPGTQPAAAEPAFAEMPLTLTLAISPFSRDISAALEAIPGLRLVTVTLTATGLTLQGVLYGQ
jgi:hypothetical protein